MKYLLMLLAIAALSGCAVTYTEPKPYYGTATFVPAESAIIYK